MKQEKKIAMALILAIMALELVILLRAMVLSLRLGLALWVAANLLDNWLLRDFQRRYRS